MSEYVSRPSLPGYVSVKEAAKILGISDKRVYEYVNEGRLPSMWAADVIMIPLDEIQKFKRRTSGRPRRSIPVWRISSGENTHFMTSIVVQIRAGQQHALLEKLEEIRQRGQDVTIYIEEHRTGKKIRDRLLRECDVHTLLHLPTGIFYA